MRILILLILCTAASLLATDGIAEIYRWKDDNGKMVFGDTPPKNKTSTAITIEDTTNSGTTFANPGQVKNFERQAESPNRQSKPVIPHDYIDSHCRNYVSQLNKVEIYLEHTKSPRDQQKALDLRKIIKMECGDKVLTQKFDDSRCRRYREDLTKTEIYLEHTHTRRDRHKVEDLRKQIALECQ
jgi:hypothetical protein